MAQIFKGPLDQAEDLLKARRETLNKRINRKGNYENYITGGSHALNNQAFKDSNDYVKGMVAPGNAWDKDPWVHGLNDRYTNPQHNDRAGNSPSDSGLNYIHRYTPSTKRGRRVSDIFFEPGRHGIRDVKSREEVERVQNLVNKYEGWKK